MHQKERRTLVYPVAVFEPSDWLRFIQSQAFTRDWKAHGLTDDDLRALEVGIMAGPNRCPVMPGAGRLRKIRFEDSHSNRGKSGAYRICYVYFEEYGSVWLVTLFGKNEKSNLTKADKNAIAKLIKEIEELLESGAL